jgi:type I thyroxine 5'-deiodinase
VIATPRSYEEKAGVARMCMTKLGIEFPALIDDFQNSTELAYTAWPDRLYVVDTAGRIAYKARPGPFGFEPREVGAVLEQLLPPAG